MAAKTWICVAATLVACGGQTEPSFEPAPAPTPATTAAPAPPDDRVQSTCDPLTPSEEPYPLGPYGFAGRASDGTVYAIDGTDFDVRVLVSEQGVLREHLIKSASAEDPDHPEWDLDIGTRLFITRVVMNGDFRHIPNAITRAGQHETLTPLATDEKAKLDVRHEVIAGVEGKGITADGSRFLWVSRSYFFSPLENHVFYGKPPMIAERRIIDIQRDPSTVERRLHIEVDGATLELVSEVDLTPAVPGTGPDPDPTHGFGTGLTFTCR